MPVKAAILDLDGTLVDETGTALVAGVADMLRQLQQLGLELFVVSGQAADRRKERLVGLSPDRFLYSESFGLKGQKKLVQHVLETLECSPTEVVYLGDSQQDMWEAANSHVLLFNASYSNGGYEYGVPVNSPDCFPRIIADFFGKEVAWYYRVAGADSAGRKFDVRSLMDPECANQTGIRNLVKGWHVSTTAKVHGYDLKYYLSMQLLASMFLDGLHLNRVERKKPVVCLYPGHAGDYGDVLRLFEQFAAKQLNVASLPGLIMRHTPTQSSKELRIAGKTPKFVDQVNSIMLDGQYRKRVQGNIVTVVDDFCTDGHAMECARNLLYAAGAESVISISVGKYGAKYYPKIPKVELSPFSRQDVAPDSFSTELAIGDTHPEALKHF